MGIFITSIVERWRRFYRKSSIQMILSLSFTAVAVVGMIFLGLTLFLRFSASNNAQMAKSSQRVLAQVNLNLDSYLRSMMRVSDTMYYRVIKNTDLADGSLTEKMNLLYESNRDSLVSIAVFSNSGDLVSASPLSTLKSSVMPQRQDWFITASKKIENLHFSTPHVQNLFADPDYRYRWVVSLSRHVELTRSGTIEGGVLLVDMSFGGIEQICKDVGLSPTGYLYLIDRSGEIIYHPRQQLIYAGLSSENNQVAAGYKDGSHQESFNGTKRLVTVKTVGYTGWKLVAVIPTDSIWDNYGPILLFGLFIIFFSVFLLVFVNLHLSERISVPIKSLDRSVKALEAGKQDVDLAVNGPYEIEHLSHSIQSMVSTMRYLMDDIIQQERSKRRSELDVLQSQINPHFLYNTLDSVVWMNENGRTEEAILMVTSLARFFRIALSRGSNIIPLEDELEHARNYLNIQMMRYKNRFTANITVPEDVRKLYTIKLIVQPILENAIYHGMAGADDDGVINISAHRDGNDVVIEISDNGPGMPEEVASRLLDPHYTPTDTRGSGIGLRNVHLRIGLTFGKQYGLTIVSEPDVGTMVKIQIPALDAEQAKEYQKEGEL